MIDPELQPYLAMWSKAWSQLPENAPVTQRRALLERLSAEDREPLPAGIDAEDKFVKGSPRSVRVRIFRRAQREPAPCLIYMHGGAFVQGSPETHAAITAEIVEKTGHTVLSADYALAPEHPFPAAVRDCEAVVRWAFENARALHIRADSISVGGDSAGANLAAVMALVFREKLRGQLLFYPTVDTDFTRPSFVENANGPIITTAGMAEAWRQYCPTETDRLHPLAVPLRAPDHAGVPCAFIAIAEHDPLRDDGKAYAARLAACCVPIELHRGAGLIHGYLRAMAYSSAARAAFAAACDWLLRVGNGTGFAVR